MISYSRRPRKDGGTLDVTSFISVGVRNGRAPFALKYVPVSFDKNKDIYSNSPIITDDSPN
jgi:hypothetical protein